MFCRVETTDISWIQAFQSALEGKNFSQAGELGGMLVL